MHNAAYAALRLDYAYVAFHVREAQLAAAISGMRALGVRGMNVTLPHKTAVLKHVDRVHPDARHIGAVNTIVNDNGILTGHNTDALGAMAALNEAGATLRNANVLLLGAGGVARAIAAALAQEDANTTVLNRTLANAEALADAFGANALALGETSLRRELANAEVVINCTKLGLKGEEAIPKRLLHGRLLVFDAVYHKGGTKLINDAKRAGCRTIPGERLLVLQGAESFKLFTGKKAPVGAMQKAVDAMLR
jgi:shikimate dehydrogenase